MAPLAAAYVPRRPTETALYSIVRKHFTSFLRHANESYEKPLPAYVEREFRAYLTCGVFAHGFVRAHCDDCGHDLLVPFSCKLRGVCPSCAGRRMANTGAHLVDRVLPDVPLRQYVLSLPQELRMLAAFKPTVLGALGRLFVAAIFAHYRKRARCAGLRRPQCGAVTFVQRFGGTLNLNVHFHVVVMDGVFTRDDALSLHFHAACAPSDVELRTIVQHTHKGAMRWLRRRGYLNAASDEAGGDGHASPGALEGCAEIAMQRGTFAQTTSDERGDDRARGALPVRTASRFVAEYERFNMHAGVHIAAGDDMGREQLCRYGARPAMALGRLRILPGGRVAYRVKDVNPARGNRAKHRVMTPLEFLARLAALIPPPRYPLVRFHGVLAPRSSWRKDVVPKPRPAVAEDCQKGVVASPTSVPRTKGTAVAKQSCGPRTRAELGEHTTGVTLKASAERADEVPSPLIGEPSMNAPATTLLGPNIIAVKHWDRVLRGKLLAKSPRIDWAALLHRTFAVDVRQCAVCGGHLRILGHITNPENASRLLGALGLPTEAPPIARARDPDELSDALDSIADEDNEPASAPPSAARPPRALE